MKTRVITSAVGISLCIAVFILGESFPIAVAIALSIVNALMCYEYLSAKKLHKEYLILIPALIFSSVMPAFSTTGIYLTPLYIYTLVLVIFSVVFHEKLHTDDLMFAFGGTTIITFSMSAMCTRACIEGGRFCAFWMVVMLGIPWLADSCAYFAGYFLGKRKLCPKISPQKTVEGAVGGLLGGILGALMIGFVFKLIYGFDTNINFIVLLILGIINSVISIFGDLAFSVIKRNCGIKDYGTILPGHGGALDRFDSVIFCTPVVYLVSQFITVIS